MRCPDCDTDLGERKTITSIQGVLLCNTCASICYSKYMLETYGERIVPADIGILPEDPTARHTLEVCK
jgi:hypothetical protein